jgi:hypothetical protein
MPHLTKLIITLTLDAGTRFEDVDHLPGRSEDTFQQISPTEWRGEFIVSCPVAPELSPGDFEDDLAPHIYDLLHLKTFHSAIYELQIAIGRPGPDIFDLKPHSVAMLASIGASITVIKQ